MHCGRDGDRVLFDLDPKPRLFRELGEDRGEAAARGVAQEADGLLAARLFPADGVVWMVSMPSAIAAETAWPDMGWVEALTPPDARPDEQWALSMSEPMRGECA